jgi:hypothetical protein
MRRFRPLAILLPCALLTTAACAPGFGPCSSRSDVATPERGPLHLLAIYGGVDQYYLADYEPGSPRALLYTPDGVQDLTQQIAASGAKYAGGRYLLWTKGRDILLEVAAKTAVSRAYRRSSTGAGRRATTSEPRATSRAGTSRPAPAAPA